MPVRWVFPGREVQQEPVVTECLKADPAVGQFYVFRHGTMVNALSPDPPESQEICRIEFQVEGKRVSHAIKSLRQIGLGASFGFGCGASPRLTVSVSLFGGGFIPTSTSGGGRRRNRFCFRCSGFGH